MKRKIFGLVLSSVTAIAAFAACLVLLFALGKTVGTADSIIADTERPAQEIGSAYDMFINNLTAGAMEGLIPIPKVYWLAEDTVVAPEPKQDNFGRSQNPADTAQVLENARGLLDGQDTLWKPDTQIMQGSDVKWYLDDTIMSITWKRPIDNAVYTFSEIKIAHPSQFRRYFADNVFSSPIQYKPSEMAKTVNAVTAMSGDFHKFRNMGVIVYGRELYRTEGGFIDSCFVDGAGDLHFVKQGEITDQDSAETYIEENDILFSLAFGPILIENGEKAVPASYPLGEINDIYARSAICQLDDCHYLLVTVNHEGGYGNCGTADSVANALLDLGIHTAYMLDGGQTAALIMNDELINAVEFGSERNISDIIYFATAIPN